MTSPKPLITPYEITVYDPDTLNSQNFTPTLLTLFKKNANYTQTKTGHPLSRYPFENFYKFKNLLKRVFKTNTEIVPNARKTVGLGDDMVVIDQVHRDATKLVWRGRRP